MIEKHIVDKKTQISTETLAIAKDKTLSVNLVFCFYTCIFLINCQIQNRYHTNPIFRVGKKGKMREFLLLVLLARASLPSEVSQHVSSETVVLASGDMELEEVVEGFKLTISIGEEREVFNLARREERADVWLAEEQDQIFSTKTQVAAFA